MEDTEGWFEKVVDIEEIRKENPSWTEEQCREEFNRLFFDKVTKTISS
jgi:hypothetical protein